jgi:hypothetical protein
LRRGDVGGACGYKLAWRAGSAVIAQAVIEQARAATRHKRIHHLGILIILQ